MEPLNLTPEQTWPPADGTPYRPSNGTEGMVFCEGGWCNRCKRDKAFRARGYEGADGCDILARTLAFDIGHPEYPVEWIWKGGEPVCTAFDDDALQITNEERAAQLPLEL